MTFYCSTNECLREYILRYFGERSANFCGNCSNCNQNFEDVDITVDTQKILSCVKRMGERYGVKMIVDTLRGSKNERLLSLGLDHLSTYGIMKETKEQRLREIIQFLLLHDYLRSSDSEYPVLCLGSNARKALFDAEKIQMKLPKEEAPKPKKAAASQLPPENKVLFDRLKKLRASIAFRQSVPAYIVFTDATLREMAAVVPQTEEELMDISGIGQRKLEKYGDTFLSAIREFLQDEEN